MTFFISVSALGLTGGTTGLLINPVVPVVSTNSAGNLVITKPSVISTVTTSQTIWDRFSTLPLLQLNGLEGAVYFKIIFTLVLIWIGAYIYSEGRDITDTLARRAKGGILPRVFITNLYTNQETLLSQYLPNCAAVAE